MKKYKISFLYNNKVKSKIVSTNDIKEYTKDYDTLKIRLLDNSFFKTSFIKRVNKYDIQAMFFELDMILNSKLSLYEALEIVENSTKNIIIKDILNKMKYCIKNGIPIHKYLKSYEHILSSMVLDFFKIAYESGNLEKSINSIYTLLKNINDTKKTIWKSLQYPLILLMSLVLVIFLMFMLVIPKFEFIFDQFNSSLPLATILLIGTKNFIINYFLYIFTIFLSLYIFFYYQYKTSKIFLYKIDKIVAAKIPYISNMIFLYSFHRFFLALNILLKSNHKFQTAINQSSNLLRNKYLFDKIRYLNQQIKNGSSISKSFENSLLFDDLILRLIYTGDQSNNLDISINEIENIFKQKIDEKLKSFSSFVEPIFIFFIMIFVLWLVLGVLLPMWSLSDVINN
jgi:general secretion pathway protein F